MKHCSSIIIPFLGVVNREASIGKIDRAIEYCLIGLLIVLPIAHVTAMRSFFIVVSVSLWIARIVISGDRNIRTPVDLAMMAYAFAVMVSIFLAIHPATAAREVQNEMLQYLLPFYIAAYIFRHEEQVNRLVVILCCWIITFGLIGMLKFFLDGGELASRIVRLNSIAKGCTNYSDYIVLTFPLVAWTAFRMRGIASVIGKIALGVALITLALTHSRAGWIAVSIEIVIILYMLLRKKMLAGGFIAVLMLTYFLLPSDILWHGTKTGISMELAYHNSESGRLYQWVNGLQEALDHPFHGYGYGRKNYVAGMENAGRKTIDTNACNAFLDSWLQLGIQGMLALFVVFITLMAAFIKYARRNASSENLRSFCVCGFITVFGYFLVNQVESSYLDEMAMTFWLLMGVLLGYAKSPRYREQRLKNVTVRYNSQ